MSSSAGTPSFLPILVFAASLPYAKLRSAHSAGSIVSLSPSLLETAASSASAPFFSRMICCFEVSFQTCVGETRREVAGV